MVYRYLRECYGFPAGRLSCLFFQSGIFSPRFWMVTPPPPLPGAGSGWIKEKAAGYPVSKEVK